MLTDLRRWYAYNDWANARLLGAAVTLRDGAAHRDLGGSFGTVFATLVHMLGAEWVWIERFHGRSPRELLAQAEWRTVHDLAAPWAAVAARQRALLDGLAEDALAAPLTYTNFAGVSATYALGDVLRHAVNHSTYHRGQVAAMLRMLGSPAPSTDFVRFLDAEAGK
jgi:uncharacterized damage-inducible protein DinB